MALQALALLLAAVALPALAQSAEIQKELIRRQQQSDAFTLQLRQSQESVKAPSGRKLELESRHLAARQRLENVSEKQLLEVKSDTPQELQPQERQKAEEERRAIVAPVTP
ncbi:MAG: hypothetical protein AB1452_04430 [Pseudomonadota bacterium]